MTRDGLFLRMSDEQWSEVLDTNLRARSTAAARSARTMMKARYGRIVNITSVVGLMGNAGQANYAASKAGLIGLTKALARELAPRGVTVNAVVPGLHRDGDDRRADRGDAQADCSAAIPLGRFGAAGRRGRGGRVPRLAPRRHT